MLNIVPLNDLIEHEDSSTCPCSPSVQFENGEMIIVHNSIKENEQENNTSSSTSKKE